MPGLAQQVEQHANAGVVLHTRASVDGEGSLEVFQIQTIAGRVKSGDKLSFVDPTQKRSPICTITVSSFALSADGGYAVQDQDGRHYRFNSDVDVAHDPMRDLAHR